MANTYGVIPTRLVESEAWIALPAAAKVVYVTCESLRGNTLAGIFPYHLGVIAQYAGLSIETCGQALDILCITPSPATSYIVRDARILWLRHHLRQRPGVSEANGNHRIAVRDIVMSLPHDSDVVRKYRQYNKSWFRSHADGPRIPSIIPSIIPSESHPYPASSTSSSTSTKLPRARATTPPRPPRPPSPAAPDGAPAGSTTGVQNGSPSPSPTYDAIRTRLLSDHPDWTAHDLDAAALRDTLAAVLAARRV